MTRGWWLALAILSVPVVTVLAERYYAPRYATLLATRQRVVAAQDELQIAVVWPRKAPMDDFVRGAIVAADEVNRRGGVRVERATDGPQNRPLRLRFFDERDAPAGAEIARQIARDTDIAAALGHATESILPATISYQESGVLFVAPTSTDPAVTRHNFDYVFRLARRDAEIAQSMATVAEQLAPRKPIRVALVYPEVLDAKSPGGVAEMLTLRVNALAEAHGEKIEFFIATVCKYPPGTLDFSSVIQPLLAAPEQFNVVLIADVLPDAGTLREQLDAGLAATSPQAVHDKLILDLDELDWSREAGFYFDFTPEQSNQFFEAIARLVLQQTRQRAVVLAARSEAGRRLATQIGSSINNTAGDPFGRFTIAVQRSFDVRKREFAAQVADPSDTKRDYTLQVAETLRHRPDVVFVAGTGDAVPALIDQLRTAGMDRPIICGVGLESLLLVRRNEPALSSVQAAIDERLESEPSLGVDELLGWLRREQGYTGPATFVRRYAAEFRGKTYVAATFNPQSPSPKVQLFLENYREAFELPAGSFVTTEAAQGYFAVQLIRQAFEQAEAPSPRAAAGALRLFVDDEGILGNSRFSTAGDLQGLEFVFKRIDSNGELIVVTLAEQIPPVGAPTEHGGGGSYGAK